MIDLEERWQAMEDLAQLPINEIWEPWCRIANHIIPKVWELKDALEGCEMPILSEYAPGSDDLADLVMHRIDYLSDRLDPARAFMLDYMIRYYFDKPMRELDPELGYRADKPKGHVMTKAKILELVNYPTLTLAGRKRACI